MKKVFLLLLIINSLFLVSCFLGDTDSEIETIKELPKTGADRSPADNQESEVLLNNVLSNIKDDINWESSDIKSRNISKIDLTTKNVNIDEESYVLSFKLEGDLYMDDIISTLIGDTSINEYFENITTEDLLNQSNDPLLSSDISVSIDANMLEKEFINDDYSYTVSGNFNGSGTLISNITVETSLLNILGEIDCSAGASFSLILSVLQTDNLDGKTVGAKYKLIFNENINFDDFGFNYSNVEILASKFSEINMDVEVYNDNNIQINSFSYNGETIIATLLSI